jgi:multicomponent K+:H+ antiporter subunit E
MKRLLPAPLLSVALFLLWLLLTRSLSAGHLILATVLALAVPLLTRGLRPLPVRIRKPTAVLRLGLRVVVDTVVSNLDAARILVFPSRVATPRLLCGYRCRCATPMPWRCWR